MGRTYRPLQDKTVKDKRIYITRRDRERLRALIEEGGEKNDPYLYRLENELNAASIIESKDVPGDVVTMNSVVRVRDLQTGEEKTFLLSFPEKAGLKGKAVSILAPIGLALIGYREGDVLEWDLPSGPVRVQIVEIVYQPERVGNYDL